MLARPDLAPGSRHPEGGASDRRDPAAGQAAHPGS
jgi:hypothetical protein